MKNSTDDHLHPFPNSALKRGKAKGIDVNLLASNSVLLGLDPRDNLAAFISDYTTLKQWAAIDARSEIAAQYYEECKTVLKEYDVARVRRDFALLLLKTGKLYRGEYESFAKFVKDQTDLSVSQAYKNANRALVLLVFEDAGMLPLVPQGRIADQLVGLPAKHWIAAWKDVLQSADGRPLTGQEVKTHLHQYKSAHGLLKTEDDSVELKTARHPLQGPAVPKRASEDPMPPSHAEADLQKLDQLLEALLPVEELNKHRSKQSVSTAEVVLAALSLNAKRRNPAGGEEFLVLLEMLNALAPRATRMLMKDLRGELRAFILRCVEKRGRHLSSRNARNHWMAILNDERITPRS